MKALRRTLIGLTGAAALLALGASSASAVTIVGSNFAATPDSAPAPGITLTQGTQPTAGTLPVASPSTGVIVRIRMKHNGSGADPGTYGFRLLSGAPQSFTSQAAPAELPDFTWPANDPAGIRTFQPAVNNAPKGIPINANERLAFTRLTGALGQGAQVFSNAGSPGGSMSSLNVALTPGTAQNYTGVANAELLAQFDVEPDADKDKFGDETQDNCVGQAGDVRGCPKAAKKAKKCKKKGKSKASAAAPKGKKCKKKGKKK